MGTNFILFVMMAAGLLMTAWKASENTKATKGERFSDIALIVLYSIGLVVTIVNLMLF